MDKEKNDDTNLISPQEGAIINQEIVYVEGVPITFTLYENNGIYAETVSIGKNQLTRNSITDQTDLMDKILSISEERAKNLYTNSSSEADSMLKDNFDIGTRAYHAWTESKNNAEAGTGFGETKNVYAGHWSEVDYTALDTAGSMKAYNGASRSLYNGNQKVKQHYQQLIRAIMLFVHNIERILEQVQD